MSETVPAPSGPNVQSVIQYAYEQAERTGQPYYVTTGVTCWAWQSPPVEHLKSYRVDPDGTLWGYSPPFKKGDFPEGFKVVYELIG